MARKFAQILVTIWDDDDFLDLAVNEQWLYQHLITQADLSYAGVMDWRPKKITQKAADITLEDIELAANVLQAKRYIIIDDGTEEILVRSFMRSDGLLKQKNMGAAVAKAYTSTGSRELKGIIVHELHRLHAENPSWGSWEFLADVMQKRAIDPSGKASANPSENPSNNPSTTPTDDPPF